MELHKNDRRCGVFKCPRHGAGVLEPHEYSSTRLSHYIFKKWIELLWLAMIEAGYNHSHNGAAFPLGVCSYAKLPTSGLSVQHYALHCTGFILKRELKVLMRHYSLPYKSKINFIIQSPNCSQASSHTTLDSNISCEIWDISAVRIHSEDAHLSTFVCYFVNTSAHKAWHW